MDTSRVLISLTLLVLAVLPATHQIGVSTQLLGIPAPPMTNPTEPVVFSAVRASDNSRRTGLKVFFDNTITDIGYGWYSDRSEFICYYPGTYFFSFNALSTSSSAFKMSLMKNNVEIVSAWADGNGYHSGSNSAIITLVRGDRVFLSIREGAIHETKQKDRGYTTFNGFRLL